MPDLHAYSVAGFFHWNAASPAVMLAAGLAFFLFVSILFLLAGGQGEILDRHAAVFLAVWNDDPFDTAENEEYSQKWSPICWKSAGATTAAVPITAG